MFYHLHLEKAKVEMRGWGTRWVAHGRGQARENPAWIRWWDAGNRLEVEGDQALNCAEWERSGSWPLEFWPQLLKVGRREEE